MVALFRLLSALIGSCQATMERMVTPLTKTKNFWLARLEIFLKTPMNTILTKDWQHMELEMAKDGGDTMAGYGEAMDPRVAINRNYKIMNH